MLLLPLWREVLHAPVCIQIFRNPVEVASSLHTRNQIPMEVGLALWEFYVRHGLAASGDLPSTTVSHRQLITEPGAAVATLRSSLEGFGVSGLRTPSANEIESFVADELYREREGRSELQPYRKAPQVKLFRDLVAGRAAVRDGEGLSEAAMRHLRAYEASLPPLQPRAKPKPAAPQPDPKLAETVSQVLAELRRRDGQFAQLEKQLGESGARLESLAAAATASADTAAGALDAAREANRQLVEDRAARDERIRELEGKWKAEAKLRDTLAREAEVCQARVAELEAQLAAASAREEALIAELQARDARIATLAGELDAAHAVMAQRDASLAEATSGLARLEGQLERRNREAQRRQQRIAEADAEIAMLRAAAERLGRDLEAAKNELVELRGSLASTRKVLATEEQRRSAAEDSLEFRIEEIVRLTRALMGQEERVSLLSKDLEAANEREARALDHLAESQAAAAEADARVEELTSDLEATARALVHTRGSRSWRATSLLRSALARLRPGTAGKAPPMAARSLLRGSGLFDEAWYVAQYPDVAASGMDALDHYLSFGAAEGRDPSATFDTRAYFARHPGLAESGINPLVHALLAAPPEERE